MADSISLEETNALRAKLGLPALGGDDDAEETVDQDTQAYENYQKQKQEEGKAKQEQEIRDRIERSKNRKKELAKLKGKGLGEADDDDVDALAWIRKSRKREKELAAKRAKEQAEMDEEFVASYSASDLSGLKVGHDITEFAEGGETILTLKDRGILDENDDDAEELTNVNLEDKERLQKNLDNKKKKPGYNPYDDEEFLLGGNKKKSVLPQYEDEEGPQGFQIGQQGRIDRNEEKQTVSEKLKAQTLSYEKMQEIKDYYTQDEVNLSFKKPKKKKKKDKLRKRVKEDEEPLPVKEEETPAKAAAATAAPAAPKPTVRDIDTSFVDDDDLQLALSRTRRAANRQREKKTKKMTVEEIAQSIAAERTQHEQEQQEEEEGEGGLVLSEMSEFVNSIGTDAVFTPREPARSVREAQAAAAAAEEEEEEEEHVNSTSVHMEEVPEDHMEEESTAAAPEQEESAIMEEPLVSKGMAATLSLLSQKGFVAKPTKEQIQRDRDQAERMRWIAEQKKIDLQRERERQQERLRQRERDGSARNSGRDRERAREREREREREKELEEREAMREFEKRMQDYKPDVKLEYFDEHGHQMNTKEAFRFMSHKFHGKTSGKAKTEKRMQKMEEELKLNMMSNSDTPLNLATKLLERQQRTGNAHVVLSVGNRGVVAPSMPADLAAESSKAPKRPRAKSESDEGPSDKKRK